MIPALNLRAAQIQGQPFALTPEDQSALPTAYEGQGPMVLAIAQGVANVSS